MRRPDTSWVTSNRLFTLARSGRRLPHPLLAVPLMVVFLVVSALLGGAPAFLALRAIFPGGSASLAGQPFLLGLGETLLLIGATGPVFLLLWAWLRAFEKRPFTTLGLERAGAGWKYARGFLVGAALLGAGVGLSAAAGYIDFERGGGRAAFNPGALGGVLVMLAGWAVQGASEEVLVRGWLMNVVGARVRPWAGVLVSALVFAGLHGLNPNLTPVALLNLCLFGLFSAFYALREGGLWGVCAEHAAWNWLQGNGVGLAVSGLDRAGPVLLDLQEVGPDLITGGAFGPEGGLAVTAVLVVAILALVLWPARPADQPAR